MFSPVSCVVPSKRRRSLTTWSADPHLLEAPSISPLASVKPIFSLASEEAHRSFYLGDTHADGISRLVICVRRLAEILLLVMIMCLWMVRTLSLRSLLSCHLTSCPRTYSFCLNHALELGKDHRAGGREDQDGMEETDGDFHGAECVRRRGPRCGVFKGVLILPRIQTASHPSTKHN